MICCQRFGRSKGEGREGGERGRGLGCVVTAGEEEGEVREGGHGGGMSDLQGGPKLLRIQNRQTILFICADTMYYSMSKRIGCVILRCKLQCRITQAIL